MIRMRPTSAVRRNKNRRGFTLIEIMVVIVVIAIIAALVAPNVFSNVGEAKVTAAKAQMSTISSALEMYRLHNLRYPSSEQGLNALRELPTLDTPRAWKGPYLMKPIPLDPFGNPYIYVSPGEFNPDGFDLYSLGADNAVGGEGLDADIYSWVVDDGNGGGGGGGE
jgi:general secretion pathway protein G